KREPRRVESETAHQRHFRFPRPLRFCVPAFAGLTTLGGSVSDSVLSFGESDDHASKRLRLLIGETGAVYGGADGAAHRIHLVGRIEKAACQKLAFEMFECLNELCARRLALQGPPFEER